MNSSYTLSKSLCRLSIILLVAYSAKAEEIKKDNGPPIDQDLPLVLISTNTKEPIRLPTTVKMKKAGVFDSRKMIQFSTWYWYFNQGFYCPAENDDQRGKILEAIRSQYQAESLMKEKIDEHCLLKKKQPGAVPAPQCQTQPRPKIMKMFEEERAASAKNEDDSLDSGEIRCGSLRDEGKMLGFGYQVCLDYEGLGNIFKTFKNKPRDYPFKGTKEVLFYNLCYSDATNEILFTTHTITGSELFSDPLLEKDRQKMWPIEAYNSIHLPNIDFEEVKWKLEKVEQVSDFKIQLLVHPEDFAVGLWKKPAYHYANAGLMHGDLQQCWNSIHEEIQGKVWEVPKALNWNYMRLTTGAFKLSETGIPQIINDVHIPEIWVKIAFFHDHYAVAIIANNYRERSVDNIITDSLNCKENLCKKFLEEKFPNVLDDIRCCALTDEIRALFGIKLKSIGILEISSLFIVDEEKRKERERFTTSGGGRSGHAGGTYASSYGLTSYAAGDVTTMMSSLF